MKDPLRQQILTIIFFVILFNGWFNPLFGYFLPLCMVAGIGSGYFFGKRWCGRYCPRGGFYDLCCDLTCKNRTPEFYSGISMKIVTLFILVAIMLFGTYLNWPSITRVGHFYVLMLTSTTVIGIILGFYYRSRIWCLFCPVGSISGWLGQMNRSISKK